MSLKILHTADWHIGQTFFEFDRTFEHHQFLNWLTQTIAEKEIDVLLICGDVFDVSNPSAASIRMFYEFLKKATQVKQNLQIIVIAGNHDSPSRLEMPNPLLEAFNIHVVGSIQRDANGNVDYGRFLIPLKNFSGKNYGYCIAMPYIRMCDFLPGTYNGTNLAESISQIYQEACEFALSKRSFGEAIIAMGHLHVLNAEISDNDKSERQIMGGLEYVPASAFHNSIAYVGLGHIHKAQKINKCDHIRYSGSPLPMSFSEINYKHQVVYFEIANEKCVNISILEVPVTVELLKIPSQHKHIDDVIKELLLLPGVTNNSLAPYLEVRVLLSGPEPSLRHKIEAVLNNKHVRLAKIDVKYQQTDNEKKDALTFDRLQELRPIEVFQKIYKHKFQNDVPEPLISIFKQIVTEVQSPDNNI